jgi:hypothetical protein
MPMTASIDQVEVITSVQRRRRWWRRRRRGSQPYFSVWVAQRPLPRPLLPPQ